MTEFREATASVDALATHLALLQAPPRWRDEDPEAALRSIQDAVAGDTDALMDKFRARCTLLDPVTSAPRFGPKMLARVQELLARYDVVKAAIVETPALVHQVEQFAAQQQQHALAQQQQLELVREEAQQAAEQQQRALEHAQALAAAAAQAQREREQALERDRIAALAALAQQKRDARQLAKQAEVLREQQEEAQRVAAAAAFPVGRVGLERAIALLQTSTDSLATLRLALQQLHAIVTTICQAPENAAVRRIPKHNAHFERDVGQWRGGYECLLALGFYEKEESDDQSVVFVLDEPDLEVDMDAWSNWFENLRAMSAFLESVLATQQS